MTDALKALACREPISKAARLRAALSEIDDALAAGASHMEILDALNQRGLNLTFTVYQTTLFRIRKQKNKGKSHAAKATATAQTTQAITKPISGTEPFTFDKEAVNHWK